MSKTHRSRAKPKYDLKQIKNKVIRLRVTKKEHFRINQIAKETNCGVSFLIMSALDRLFSI